MSQRSPEYSPVQKALLAWAADRRRHHPMQGDRLSDTLCALELIERDEFGRLDLSEKGKEELRGLRASGGEALSGVPDIGVPPA
jgi:hypothetical protein